jgi:hypothetical protein
MGTTLLATVADFFWNPGVTEDTMTDMNTNLNYILSVVWFILWIVALVDCVKSSNPNKVVWVIVIILLPFLGSILYFLLGRKNAV